MSLAARVQDQPETIHGVECSVASLWAQVEANGPAEVEALQYLMYGRKGLTETTRGYKGRSERQVFEAVTAEGYTVAKNQINEHRGKRCRCYRDKR